MHLAQTALFGVIGVLALLLVLRPMVLRLTTLGAAGALAGGRRYGARRRLTGPARLPRWRLRRWPALLAGRRGSAAAAAGRREHGEHRPDRRPDARVIAAPASANWSSKHPDETLSIVRGWMAQESG